MRHPPFLQVASVAVLVFELLQLKWSPFDVT